MTKLKHLAKKITKSLVTFYDGLSAATLTLTGTWPTNGARLQVVASAATGHTDCTGRVTINGVENIDFIAAGTKNGTNSITSRPTITTSGLDCNLLISCLDSGSQPIYTSTETDLPCRIWLKRKSVQQANGVWTTIQETLLWVRDLTIIPSDKIKFDLTDKKDPTDGITYTVSATDPIEGPGGVEHLRILRF